MFTKSEKTMQGLKIKDAIQQLLLTTPMKYGELMLHFDVAPQAMKNYLASLKLQELIKYHPDDMNKHISSRRLVAIPDMPTFSEVIEEAWNKRKQGAAVAREKRNAIVEKTKEKDYITVITADDYHTKGSQEKRSAWIGTTFGTMEY